MFLAALVFLYNIAKDVSKNPRLSLRMMERLVKGMARLCVGAFGVFAAFFGVIIYAAIGLALWNIPRFGTFGSPSEAVGSSIGVTIGFLRHHQRGGRWLASPIDRAEIQLAA